MRVKTQSHFCTSHCTLFQTDLLKQGQGGENCEEVALVFETCVLVEIVIIAYTMTQFSSVTQSCPTLCDPKNCSTPGLPVHHQLPEFTQTHVHWVIDAISSSVITFSSCPQSLPPSGSFPMSQLFAWGGQSIGVSASASVLPMNTQVLSPLGWTGWISLQS